MKTIRHLLIAAVPFFSLPALSQTTQVPGYISYQGRVLDSTGALVGAGAPVNRTVIFRMWSHPSNTLIANLIYSEQQVITIAEGEFSALVGQGVQTTVTPFGYSETTKGPPTVSIANAFGGDQRYLGVTVDDGTAAVDNEISPRQQIVTTAYSFRARSADTIASDTDLQLNGSSDYGLGYYGSTRQFNGISVNGPVLFGQAGGALGSVNGGSKNIALRWNAAGAVGIGSADLTDAAATTKLVLQGDDPNTVPLQLNIRGNSDTNKRLLLGYNTTSNYGSLQAYSTVSTATNLLLNPVGGGVVIGTTGNIGFEKLRIATSFPKTDTTRRVVMEQTTNEAVVPPFQGNPFTLRTELRGAASPADRLAILQTGDAWDTFNGNIALQPDAGKVGIGTFTPGAKLDINGNVFAGGPVTGSHFEITGNQIVQFNAATPAVMHLNLPGGSVTMCGNGIGNVGIGTTAPTEKLDVAGTVKATSFVGNGAGLTNLTPPPGMVFIPAGAFTMGNTVAADTDITNAAPVSTTVSAFYMDVNEVTLSKWQSVYYWAQSNGYTFAAGAGKGPNHPVQTVSWYDVVKWCNARSEQAGKTPVYYTNDAQTTVYRTGNVNVTNVQVKWTANGYRLPTEAEWEKAARGGLSGQRFPWGNSITQNLANYLSSLGGYDLGPDGYNAIGSIGGTSPATSPVGSFASNGYGLNDMSGNVFEWCWDWIGTPYAGGTDPKGVASGSNRVLRGGNWGNYANDTRCALRGGFGPGGALNIIGFRAVLAPGQ